MVLSSKKFKSFIIYYILIFLIIFAVHLIFRPFTRTTALDNMMQTYNIESVTSEEDAVKILQEKNVTNIISVNKHYIFKVEDGSYYCVKISNTIDYALELSAENVQIQDGSSSGSSGVNFFVILNLVFIILFIVYLVIEWRRARELAKSFDLPSGLANMTLGGEDFSENDKDVINKVDVKKFTFDDVQGIDELKPDLYRLVDCLKNPDKYKEIGARMTKGEAGVPFFSMCGSDFMEKYVGVGAARVRELYAKARKNAPCIVFIDEIDAIGGGRGESNSGEKDQTINALLAELDGFKSVDNILTICATNRLDILDPALLRPGRFDLKLAIGLPDKDGRLAILKLHAKNKKLSDDISLEDLSKKTIVH